MYAAYRMTTEGVVLYLTKMKSTATEEMADCWHKLEELYAKKLWHPLTQETRKLLNTPEFVKKLNLKEFYEQFVSTFELRINSLHLVDICIPVSKYIAATDKEGSYKFLAKIEKTVSKDKVAVARCHTGEIEIRLSNKDAQDAVIDITKIRSMIESTQKEVDALVGVTDVHAPFYKVSASYLKEVGDFAGYYREALRYLGVEDASKLSEEEKHVQAVMVAFAALLGENVYNFGELLAHPILKALHNSSEKWLVEMLFAFNSGDLNKFYSLEKFWTEWNDLKVRKDFLLGKLRLMAVMEIALARPSKERNISFSEIASKCQIALNEVEFLVMKALSKDLIHGSINQVQQTVNISWVQARVLNSEQMLSMASRIVDWKADVTSMENIVAEDAKEILIKK